MIAKITTFIIILTLLSCSSSIFHEYSEIEEISVFTSPGKPGFGFSIDLPAEKIIARKLYNQYQICILRKIGQDSIAYVKEGYSPLTPAEWDTLITIIQTQQLFYFKPIFVKERVNDYGSRGYSILGKYSIIQRMNKPIENADIINPLFRYLSQLARQKVMRLELHYLKDNLY
ncbi:MAG: hypothetical protein HY964_06540 [Ignavibacteriales bacterium]|nr:hypothetical protein [Ignavibacteriales bacterium]